MQKTEKRQVNFYTKRENTEKFQRLYPYMLSKFLIACMEEAINNNEFTFEVLKRYAERNRNI